MRRLTIYREKTVAACFMTVKFYITSNAIYDGEKEVVIGGEQCRKLGELKNGEEKTFLINEESAKVFAISDLASKNIWDQISIPEGTGGIRIGGKSMLAPWVGNPFNFKEQILTEEFRS